MEKEIPKPERRKLYVKARGVGVNSIEITIPRSIADLLKIYPGTRLEMDVSESKYGKRISLWNYGQQIKRYKERVGEKE